MQICYMYTCKTMADPLRVCSTGRSSRRPSTVGEQLKQIMATMFCPCSPDYLTHSSVASHIHTKQTKYWPYFGAFSGATRWRKDRKITKLLQIRASTFGLGPNVKLQPCHKATQVLPKFLSITLVVPLDPFDSPAKYDIPCNVQPFR